MFTNILLSYIQYAVQQNASVLIWLCLCVLEFQIIMAADTS